MENHHVAYLFFMLEWNCVGGGSGEKGTEQMNVNHSGYYKWKSRRGHLNRYERDRVLLTQLLKEEHEKYPSHGYHRLADGVFDETGWIVSHDLAHKCCKAAGIHSKARTIIEDLNSWMKEELYLDFSLADTKDVPALLEEYVYYFNNKRRSAALGYKSSVQYKTELGF